jgi:hypothetical protein
MVSAGLLNAAKTGMRSLPTPNTYPVRAGQRLTARQSLTLGTEKMKWKLIFGILASVLLAAITPVITTFLVGGVYAKLILGKGGNYAESIIGWVAGLWIAPVVLIAGITYSVLVYRKSKPDSDEPKDPTSRWHSTPLRRCTTPLHDTPLTISRESKMRSNRSSTVFTASGSPSSGSSSF